MTKSVVKHENNDNSNKVMVVGAVKTKPGLKKGEVKIEIGKDRGNQKQLNKMEKVRCCTIFWAGGRGGGVTGIVTYFDADDQNNTGHEKSHCCSTRSRRGYVLSTAVVLLSCRFLTFAQSKREEDQINNRAAPLLLLKQQPL